MAHGRDPCAIVTGPTFHVSSLKLHHVRLNVFTIINLTSSKFSDYRGNSVILQLGNYQRCAFPKIITKHLLYRTKNAPNDSGLPVPNLVPNLQVF